MHEIPPACSAEGEYDHSELCFNGEREGALVPLAAVLLAFLVLPPLAEHPNKNRTHIHARAHTHTAT